MIIKERTSRNGFVYINGKKRFICKHHGLVSEKDTYVNKHSGSKEYGQCRICLRTSTNKYYVVGRKKYCDLSEEEKTQYIKNQQERRLKSNWAEKQKKRDKANSEELKDPYIKNMIRQRLGIPAKEVPPVFVEIYRAIIKIKRIKYKRM